MIEGANGTALTGDYLRVAVRSRVRPDPGVLHRGRLSPDGSRVLIGAAAPETDSRNTLFEGRQ